MWPWKKKQKVLVVGNEALEGKIDRYSSTWIAIENWANEGLQAARERNDLVRLDAIETSALRGKIAKLKELLALPNEKGPGNRSRNKRSPILADQGE